MLFNCNSAFISNEQCQLFFKHSRLMTSFSNLVSACHFERPYNTVPLLQHERIFYLQSLMSLNVIGINNQIFINDIYSETFRKNTFFVIFDWYHVYHRKCQSNKIRMKLPQLFFLLHSRTCLLFKTQIEKEKYIYSHSN